MEEIKENKIINKTIFAILIIFTIILIGIFIYMIVIDKKINKTEEKEEITILKNIISINDVDSIYDNINKIEYNDKNTEMEYEIKDGKISYRIVGKDINETYYEVEFNENFEIKKMVLADINDNEIIYVLTNNNEVYNFKTEDNTKKSKFIKILNGKAIDNITTKYIIDEKNKTYNTYLAYKYNNDNYIYIDENNSKLYSSYIVDYEYNEFLISENKQGYTINNKKELIEYHDKTNKIVYKDSNNNSIIPKYILNEKSLNKIYIITSNTLYESDINFNIKSLGNYTNLNINETSLELKINDETYKFTTQ